MTIMINIMDPEMGKVRDVRDAKGNEKQIWDLEWLQEPLWRIS